jgi:hypothetical protein
VEGDPYAAFLVGLVAGEFLEPSPAEGERPATTASRAQSRDEARVTIRVDRYPDLSSDDVLQPLIALGVIRVEGGDETPAVPSSLPVDAVVAFGEAAFRFSRDLLRRRGRSNTISIIMPIVADERHRRSDDDSNDGRSILDAAEEAVAQARAAWREQRASDRSLDAERRPVDYGFAEDSWLDWIPHALYAQLLIERLLRGR